MGNAFNSKSFIFLGAFFIIFIMDAGVEVTIKSLIPQELHFLINPNLPQQLNTSEMLSDILYSPKDMFKAAELAYPHLPFQNTQELYVLSISSLLLSTEATEPFNRWITAVERLRALDTDKRTITALLKIIESWLYLNETYLTSENPKQASWHDREALDTAKTRLQDLKAQFERSQ